MSTKTNTLSPKRAITLVERTAAKFDTARFARDESLVLGSEAGLSLRQLATASGLGVETVRRILIANGVTT